MNVIRAQKAGFCMGVALALHKLDNIISANPTSKVATLGEIIHNPQVMDEYTAKGVRCLKNPEEATLSMCVLIRAHGIPRSIEEQLRKRCSQVEDATCPRVKKAQIAIEHATSQDKHLLLYGEEFHPEVQGLISYSSATNHIFSTIDELDRILCSLSSNCKIILAAQTTQDRIIFDQIKIQLKNYFKQNIVVLDTICDATRQRQEEAASLAGTVQAMVVVGGRNSGNTKRLAELSRMNGVPTILIETPEEIDPTFFYGLETIGITAGASTPKKMIDAVEAKLLLL